jgi:hypothetical protein
MTDASGAPANPRERLVVIAFATGLVFILALMAGIFIHSWQPLTTADLKQDLAGSEKRIAEIEAVKAHAPFWTSDEEEALHDLRFRTQSLRDELKKRDQ